MKRALLVLVAIVALGWIGFRIWRGPAPEDILASIDVPPAPVLSPEEELATFRTAPGFRAELVAAEPLVVDPVAMDWDDEGRLYVVEMRGYMPNVDGDGEDAPVGRVVVLEDTDGDGRMDQSSIFLDELVLPRAVAVLPQGVLVAEQPNLWLCRDDDADLRCDEKIRITSYAEGRTNPEHQENALLPGFDNWIYNSRSTRRFRFDGDQLIVEPTQMRGQWGIAQDDDGRLYYNHNSGFLYVDEIPADYLHRQPSTATRNEKVGVNVPLTNGELVHGVRVAPGLNRAYLAGTLRPDGRQNGPTGVSGLTIQRGDQYGPEFVGDAFVPEAAGGTVSHFSVDRSGSPLRAEHRLYDDPEWEKREFLASTDERFRPVDARFGPDGAVWVIDMYRGVIQHAEFVSDHLRGHIERQDLEPPGSTGRIWRIVREDRPISYAPPPLRTAAEQLAALGHPNGWVRDRAQRRLITDAPDDVLAELRSLGQAQAVARRHALWVLSGRGELDLATWNRGLGDEDPGVRMAALRAGESGAADQEQKKTAMLRVLADDPSPAVRLQALHSLGSLPADVRPWEVLVRAGREGDPLVRQAALSGLAGLEFVALRDEMQERAGTPSAAEDDPWLAGLAAAALRASENAPREGATATDLLEIIESAEPPGAQLALLRGIAASQRSAGASRVELPEPHSLFAEEAERDGDARTAIQRVRAGFTWPGDPRPGGARALTAEEERRRVDGAALFKDTCASCHGEDGRGRAGQAPSLVGSTWVRDSDDWLVRIVLHGLTGPIEIDGKEWNLNMPGHADGGEHFGDEAVAGLLTFLRRAWGHAEDPISPETVARIRTEAGERNLPWTVAELRHLAIEHRLDRYVGIYEVPVVGTQIEIIRQDSNLAVGQPGTGKAQLDEAGGGLFLREEVSIRFESDEAGIITGANASYNGMSFPVSKKEGSG